MSTGRCLAAFAVGAAIGVLVLPGRETRCQGTGERVASAGADGRAWAVPAGYGQHVSDLRGKLPDDGFTIVTEPPFVVIGDESPGVVRERAKQTVKWAVDRLRAQFFPKAPNEILDVWLFKDKESYERHTRELFGHAPTTPYGFYSSQDHAMVMNIATGGGTLVHEIVHPLMAANFPACPAWFNEGMGSLFEQSTDVGGKIRGLTNWRLRGLQETIRRGDLGSFRALCSTSSDEFYGEDQGTNYAQARYLCYYLQERGLLEKYYHRFEADAKRDPTGYRTLQSVLGCDDMDAFEKAWAKWVLTLTFP